MTLDILFQFLILALIVLSLLSIMLWTLKNGITPTPTSAKVKKIIFQSLPPIAPGAIVDLGSGFGSMAFALADRFPHHKVIGYETSPLPYWISQCRLLLCKRQNLQFQRLDFFHVPLTNTSLVYCYLYASIMPKIASKLSLELPPHAVVVSNTFALTHWTPTNQISINDLYHTEIYIFFAEAQLKARRGPF
jgi:SAM-dependent methyltransferase